MTKKNTDQVAVWCSLFAYTDRQISTDQFAPSTHLTPFVEAGWLVPVAHSKTVLCEVCDKTHWVDVEPRDMGKGVCRRTGEAFTISRAASLYRVDGDAFSLSLAQALDIDGRPRKVRGLQNVWSLGLRRYKEMRVAFFCTPWVGSIDSATTIISSVADQARSNAYCLLVADNIDAVRLVHRKGTVVRLQDVLTINASGEVIIDNVQLIAAVFPDLKNQPHRGRPPDQRKRVFMLLAESDCAGPIDSSNESLREWSRKYKDRFKNRSPARSTIREAIELWNASAAGALRQND